MPPSGEAETGRQLLWMVLRAPIFSPRILRRTAPTTCRYRRFPDGRRFRDPRHQTAVVHGAKRYSYAEFKDRCCALASALSKRGIGEGDTVAILAANTPPLLEAHYGVPMLGAILNALNTRLDASTIAFILEHGEAKMSSARRLQ